MGTAIYTVYSGNSYLHCLQQEQFSTLSNSFAYIRDRVSWNYDQHRELHTPLFAKSVWVLLRSHTETGPTVYPTSFPGSLFSASIVVERPWERGCGLSSSSEKNRKSNHFRMSLQI